MTSVHVKLDTIDKVKDFVQKVTLFDSDFDLRSGRYTVDAKSILGIFSLDLLRPIELIIYSDEQAPKVLEEIESYLV